MLWRRSRICDKMWLGEEARALQVCRSKPGKAYGKAPSTDLDV